MLCQVLEGCSKSVLQITIRSSGKPLSAEPAPAKPKLRLCIRNDHEDHGVSRHFAVGRFSIKSTLSHELAARRGDSARACANANHESPQQTTLGTAASSTTRLGALDAEGDPFTAHRPEAVDCPDWSRQIEGTLYEVETGDYNYASLSQTTLRPIRAGDRAGCGAVASLALGASSRPGARSDSDRRLALL